MSKIKIFEKEDFFGIITLDFYEHYDVMATTDTKYGQVGKRKIENTQEMEDFYYNSVENTIENGWGLKYDGDRNYG